MKIESYDELKHSKYRLSLMLFLFLNASVSLFCLLPLAENNETQITVPVMMVAFFSLTMLSTCLIKTKLKLPLLNPVALILGGLWAWHIQYRYHSVLIDDGGFLIVSLLCVFFISAIALSDYLVAFCLHITPSMLTVLMLDHGQHLPLILLTIALPLIGFSLQHLMRRRSEDFTLRLMYQLYEEKESFSDLSMLDPLTGLYNRRGLKNRLDNILDNHVGSHYVLLLDIDHFKAYNDNYGHAMGDQALARVSVAIRDAVRSRDVVTRYGGEEFLVLMTNVNASIAMKLAERIRQYVVNLEIPHLFNERVSTHVTISAGIAPIYDNEFDQAVANADRALYVAKNRGRNTILAWEDLPGVPSPATSDVI
ncbi:diguanylate cyclase (GGDEF)-like protein [Pantoea sp. PA1]|jgi:diguanylate cyclase (GGDEF)-like protein|uniref:GGDEF domain-containing protein n=1 Tax=Pantoea TaxID=53335 RepID=UPI0004955934|nr:MULTISPECIES: diguanylate cyclase [Pantoea]AVG75687.1 GGDEF domain-containing protein [Pantoea ananatis]MCS3404593.1 GGDEF domain-containing protein [Pantoea sp. B566]MCS4494532.1 GGDEF domain-containing protein [Pantoea sp. B623]MDH0055891.1 GGDEF domain-containing protein [Pantoea ananatis]NCU10194.1 diguanylate cyclase [Pantoea ananatis]